MPTEFLTDAHLARYGRYPDDVPQADLDDCFRLSVADVQLISQRRRDSTRLGFALQLVTLRYLHTFLIDPTDVPHAVVQRVARQLSLPETLDLSSYRVRPMTIATHQAQVRQYLVYRDFDTVEVLHLLRWVYARLLITDERPIVLFDHVTAELAARRVVLPGASVLARLIVRVRERVARRLYRQLAHILDAGQVQRLEALLVVADGTRKTPFDRLRTPPTRVTAGGMLQALGRITELQDVGVGGVDLSEFPAHRLQALSRHALTAWAAHLARLSAERRYATLLAVVQHLERSATDDALDLFDALMTSLGLRGERRRRQARLRTLHDLDTSALILRDAVRILLDADIPAADVRAVVQAKVGTTALQDAVQVVSELAAGPDDPEPAAWVQAATVITRMLPTLLRGIQFQGTPAATSLLAALKFLAADDVQTQRVWTQAPTAFIPASWAAVVMPGGVIDPRAYRVCSAHALHTHLKRREVFVTRSLRHGDPRAQLLQGEAWDRLRPEVCRSLGWSTDPQVELTRLTQQLDKAYGLTQTGLSSNAHVRLHDDEGQVTLSVVPLAGEPVSSSLLLLQTQVEARLPDIDLSELLLEVHAVTGFARDFGLDSDGLSRGDDLERSICAVLVAQACNIDLKSVAQAGIPALRLGRLTWVQQHYVRAQTLSRANARLVDAHAQQPVVQAWGQGGVASADGLRFVTPLRNAVAAPNGRYFGTGRGITYYTFTSDQFTAFHGIVIPGTLRDSLYILSGLLDQQTGQRPREIMSDTAGYSDIVFGLFHLLGYQFSPRLADIGRTRYWRLNRDADYGALNGVARQNINAGLIAAHWDDLLRLAGSLQQGAVPAPDIMRVLARQGTLSGLGKAVAELGRIAKTLYLLAYVRDETYRRRIQVQLNRGEARHSLARVVFHGRKGEVRQRYREGMEDQLGALGLVVNAIVLWNARYIGATLTWLEALGEDVLAQDVARLSPLKYGHINVLGRYHFEVPEDVAAGALRPLRDPDALEFDWTQPVEL